MEIVILFALILLSGAFAMVAGVEPGKQALSLQMAGAGVDISSNQADEAYGVQVQPSEGGRDEKQPVLLSKTRLFAIEMSHLVRSFQLGC